MDKFAGLQEVSGTLYRDARKKKREAGGKTLQDTAGRLTPKGEK
jgi:hypothetical protein